MEMVLEYKNKKTKSNIHFYAYNSYDIETFYLLSSKMSENDNRIIKNNAKKLVKVLYEVQKRKGGV